MNNNEVECEICKTKMKDLTSHIFRKHGMKAAQYREKYKNAQIRCDALLKQQSERISGDKNPGYQHGGKLSPFSENFVGGIDKISETKQKAKRNKHILNKDTTKIEYWLDKTNGDIEKAKELLSKRQSTFSLEKCIDKYGEKMGKQIWLDRQERWHKNYKKSNFSKISQELFWGIVENIENLENIYFAELDKTKQKDLSGINNEFRLKLSNKVLLPDFIDIKNKKIIEFNGEYWHTVKNKNYSFSENPDNIKQNLLITDGYSVLFITEKDYKNDKQGTITKCLNFLKS